MRLQVCRTRTYRVWSESYCYESVASDILAWPVKRTSLKLRCRELVKKEQEVLDSQLRHKHTEAQLEEAQIALQRASSSCELAGLPMNTSRLLTMMPTLRDLLLTINKLVLLWNKFLFFQVLWRTCQWWVGLCGDWGTLSSWKLKYSYRIIALILF